VRYSLNKWHESTLTYDSLRQMGRLWLDGVQACPVNFTITKEQAYDRTFGITNFGTGTAFKGYL
jgi:hypothetical protein